MISCWRCEEVGCRTSAGLRLCSCPHHFGGEVPPRPRPTTVYAACSCGWRTAEYSMTPADRRALMLLLNEHMLTHRGEPAGYPVPTIVTAQGRP